MTRATKRYIVLPRMTDRPLSIRFSAEFLERMDRLAASMSAHAAGARVPRAQAIRMSIERGATVLEAELGIAKKVPKKKARGAS